MSVRFGSVGLLAALTLVLSGTTVSPKVWGQEDASPRSKGKVVSVVLYRDSALVTRDVDFSGKASEVVVTDLPTQLQAASVFAEGIDGVSIRGVRVMTTPVSEATQEDVAELDARVASLRKELESNRRMMDVSRKQLSAIERMVAFSQQSAQSDLSRGVLDAKALMELIDGSGERRSEIEQALIEREVLESKLSLEISTLSRERQLLTGKAPMNHFQAKVFLEKEGDGPGKFRLRYSVASCSWTPQYSITTESDSDEVKVRYGAVITQASGEPWKDVRLTLSTASPSVRARGPLLTALRVSANAKVSNPPDSSFDDPFGSPVEGAPMPSQAARAKTYSGKMSSLRLQQIEAENLSSNSDPFASNQSRDSMMNRFAGEMQQLELQVAGKAAKRVASDVDQEVASQTYFLEPTVTLDSRRDQQLVEIAELSLAGEFAYVATPLLSSFIYREISVRNDSAIALLRGPASIYLDDRFVGGMEIPSTAIGQLLTIGLGADDQIRTRRELVDKSDSVQGGNRRIELTYRLVLSNFKQHAVGIQLMDRIPQAKDDRQISVQLEDTSVPISMNALYLRVSRPSGILRFDVQVPTGAHGSKAMDVVYRYSMELDRNQQVAVPDLSAQVQAGLEETDFVGGMGGGMGQ